MIFNIFRKKSLVKIQAEKLLNDVSSFTGLFHRDKVPGFFDQLMGSILHKGSRLFQVNIAAVFGYFTFQNKGRGCFLFVFLLANLGAGFIVGIFTSRNPEVYDLAYSGFLLFSFCFLFMGFNIYSSAMFTALSNGKTSAFIAFLRTFVFIILGILLLPRVIGVNGLWLALPMAEALTLTISSCLVAREYKRHIAIPDITST